MTTCPTCGQIMDPAGEAQRLLDVLTTGVPHRQVYRGADGSGWYVTHQRGQWSEPAVMMLVRAGYIHSCYSGCPTESYHVGKTLDCDATAAERKKHKRWRDAPLVYTDGSRS